MTDPQLNDPENGDYSLNPDSPATGYGCQTFVTGKKYISENKHKRDLTPDDRTTLSGTISESLLLTSLDIQVTDNVLVENGVTLAFSPGANISFNEFYHIDVQGTILAQGSADERITFTAADPYLFTYDNDLAGCWNGFKFINTNDSNDLSLFSYAIFEYAKAVATDNPGYTDAGAVFQVYNFDKLRIENSIFRNNYANYGSIFTVNKDSNITFINNQVSENKVALGGSLALINYSNPKIVSNTIIYNEVLNQDDFHSTGVIESYISKPIIYNNIMYQNIDTFFMEHQLFSAKAYHTRFNGFDFLFGNNNILLSDVNFEIITQDVYLPNTNSQIIDSATLEFLYDIQLPQTDILGNPRIYGSFLDLGAVELYPVSNDNPTIPSNNKISLYPNPFNPEITIEFPANRADRPTLTIYNIRGQVVKTFQENEFNDKKIVWNGRDNQGKTVSSGVYLFRFRSKNYTETKRALLLK